MELLVRALRRDDDRSQFRSGDASLDTFFVQYAGQHQFKACASVTYVVEGGERIAGYATVTAACIDIVDLPPEDRLRYPYPAPVLSLARLATDERDRHRGIGSMLLTHVFVLAAKMADELGCVGVVVDSKAGALSFYEKYGFKPRPVVTGRAGLGEPRVRLFGRIRPLRLYVGFRLAILRVRAGRPRRRWRAPRPAARVLVAHGVGRRSAPRLGGPDAEADGRPTSRPSARR